MPGTDPSEARIACAFLLGCVLFGFPMIAVFNVGGRVFGIPVLFAYLFAAWAALIALVALVLETRG